MLQYQSSGPMTRVFIEIDQEACFESLVNNHVSSEPTHRCIGGLYPKTNLLLALNTLSPSRCSTAQQSSLEPSEDQLGRELHTPHRNQHRAFRRINLH